MLQYINDLYMNTLGRQPTPEEMQAKMQELQNGTTVGSDLAQNLMFSTEFQNRNLNNEDFINTTYQALFGRAPDAAGLQGWLDQLNKGEVTRDQIVSQFTGSQEFIDRAQDADLIPNRDMMKDGFIDRFYSNCLGREPSAEEIAAWKAQLEAGQTDPSNMALGFMFSPEMQGRNLSDDQFIDTAYQAFFGRDPDEAGKAGWLEQLQGGVSREDMVKGFTGAGEFDNLCGNFGLKPGGDTPPATGDQKDQFINRFYGNCLGREPSAEEIAAWKAQLEAGQTNPDSMAMGFMFSPEMQNRNLSDEQFISTAYQAFFGRDADAAGKAGWLDQLQSGMSREDVVKGFTGAGEFDNLCQQYGLQE